MSGPFYVYEHLRPDTGAPFYVGKGKDRRAVTKQGRNRYWKNVVSKAGGFAVSRVADGLPEDLAHLIEMERIDQLRRLGFALTNMTDGGEGMSGFTIPRASVERRAAMSRGVPRPDVSEFMGGRPKSAEHRRRLSESAKGRRLSDETKQKLSAASRGRVSSMKGRKHTEEAKRKISEALRGEKNRFFGKTHTPETVAKIRAANIGRRDSDETRQKKSAARRGALNPLYGVPVSEERKARQIATLKARPLIVCPHCAAATNEGNARRWHFDNCKDRK